MKQSHYKDTKISILESYAEGLVSLEECNGMLELLEAEKENTELTEENIKEFFEELAEKYPKLKEDIEKLQKKIDKGEDDEGEKEESKDDTDAIEESFWDSLENQSWYD